MAISHPKVSVVIPTRKRPHLLRRAVDSVKAQDFSDWELVISDDENPSGETWEYLQQLATNDSRVILTQNPGPHGQVRNMNHALKESCGAWVKPLYDDDVLKPHCLVRLYKAVEKQESVALIRCLANRYREDTLSKKAKKGRRATLELVPQRLAHLAMYLHDVDIGIPTQVMINRACIEKGALLEDIPQLSTLYDVWWYCKVLEHGDLLLLNEALVDQHQGKHETITSNVDEITLDEEFESLRELLFKMIDPILDPPPIDVVKKMVRIMRAIHRLINRKIADALRLSASSFHYKSLYLTCRWGMSKAFPGHFRVAPRLVIEK